MPARLTAPSRAARAVCPAIGARRAKDRPARLARCRVRPKRIGGAHELERNPRSLASGSRADAAPRLPGPRVDVGRGLDAVLRHVGHAAPAEGDGALVAVAKIPRGAAG